VADAVYGPGGPYLLCHSSVVGGVVVVGVVVAIVIIVHPPICCTLASAIYHARWRTCGRMWVSHLTPVDIHVRWYCLCPFSVGSAPNADSRAPASACYHAYWRFFPRPFTPGGFTTITSDTTITFTYSTTTIVGSITTSTSPTNITSITSITSHSTPRALVSRRRPFATRSVLCFAPYRWVFLRSAARCLALPGADGVLWAHLVVGRRRARLGAV
jgi:hypothetical protein